MACNVQDIGILPTPSLNDLNSGSLNCPVLMWLGTEHIEVPSNWE